MTGENANTDEVRGPSGYENWRRAMRGVPPHSGEETPLYSDAHFTAEITQGWGPYKLLNTIGAAYQPGCVPVLMLRWSFHAGKDDKQVPDMTKTDTSTFHGGGITDEISALIGLALNVRLRSGTKTRDIDFEKGEERPRAEDPWAIPTLPRDPRRRPVIPYSHRTVKLDQQILDGYPDLPVESAIALVRAARLLQHGLWICESNPNDAWLMIVSAAEVAAVQWRKNETGGDLEKLLRALKPKWVERLERTGDGSVVADMAKELANLLGATNRFIKFLVAHLPSPPTRRPRIGQVDWSEKFMKAALNQIYEARSRALHDGTPFPAPLCMAPTHADHEFPPEERPLGLAMASSGGTWLREDLPMHLHVFEYIVHGALMKWWDGLKRGIEQEMPAE